MNTLKQYNRTEVKTTRAILFLLIIITILFSRSAYAGGKCWFVEAFKTYDYTKKIEINEKDEEHFRVEKELEKMHNTLGVRLLFKESGELLKILGFFADGNYFYNKYKYSGWKSQPCPPEHPTKIQRPGDWSKYDETTTGQFSLEDPHAGGVFMKLGNYYQIDLGVSNIDMENPWYL